MILYTIIVHQSVLYYIIAYYIIVYATISRPELGPRRFIARTVGGEVPSQIRGSSRPEDALKEVVFLLDIV